MVTDEARGWIRALALDPEFALEASSAEQLAKRLAKLETEGKEAVQAALSALGDPRRDSARGAVARKHRTELGRAGLAAYDAARVVAAVLAGVRAGQIGEAEAWSRLTMLGHAIQKTYKSWQQFVDAYELGRTVMAGGHPKKLPPHQVPTIAWKLDLGVAGPAPRTRYKRSRCGHCGGIKEQPSKTAYVYCDFCGELCDYDFSVARATAKPAEQPASPSPDDDREYRSMSRRVEAAHARGDRKTYRKLQREQYTRLASPEVASPRIADPAYRTAWIEYMAEVVTALVFDDAFAALDAAYHNSVGGITYVEVKQQWRIVPASFAPVIDAYEARTERSAQLSAELGLLERHPDRPTAAIWRSIEHSLFAQIWMPMLDEVTAQSVLARLGLAGDFDAVAPGKRSKLPCHQCGNVLEVVARARRVTCEYCGHRLELVARP